MQCIELKSSKRIIPMIYAYATPEIKRHDGHLKIGMAKTQTVEERIKQQAQTIDVIQELKWKGSAIFDDGSGDPFTDHDFRAYLYKLGYEKIGNTEYVKISAPESKMRFIEYRSNRGVVEADEYSATPYTLRFEQDDAVNKTRDYITSHPGGSFLWNAKPRFGKTLSVYDLVLRLRAQKVLIVTNRPAIANSWYSDYAKFIGRESGYYFISSVDGISKQPLVVSHDDYEREIKSGSTSQTESPAGCIEFVSLQDLKGAASFGGKFDKLKHIAQTDWDLLVIDEAHEGIDTWRTDAAFEHIRRKFTLHLSGTPFKALANETFPDGAIFNWTYADEQTAKQNWNGEGSNPYETLPKLNMLTYRMSEIVRDEIEQGIEVDGEKREFAFDLNEFFATNGSGRFVHDAAVDRFLDALTTEEKFPFSTQELRDEIRHSFWLLNRVDSARALARKLNAHPVFKDYEVVLAAGDGRMEDDDQTENFKSFNKVKKAIEEHDYTITLSVGQLTTGVTVPEWTAVLMLSSIKSPALYMQAAFRAQTPCLFRFGTEVFQKENAYVFDFDPARTLLIYDKFANDLMPHRMKNSGDTESRRENIRELLNFFPVLGENEGSEMVELDAEKVLSIPRRLKSREVVNSGFMSNYLFTDAIGVVFHAPQEMIDIINSFTPCAEPKKHPDITPDATNELDIDENGEVNVPQEKIIGLQKDIFGDKIYADNRMDIDQFMPPAAEEKQQNPHDELRERITRVVVDQFIKPTIETVRESYGGYFRSSVRKRVEARLTNEAQNIINKHETDFHIEQNRLQNERDEKIAAAVNTQDQTKIMREYEKKTERARSDLAYTLAQAIKDFQQKAQLETIRQADTSKKEVLKREQEANLRDHLRGFSRTIPSFLMAYGNENIQLNNFDTVIPEDVFLEVTGITLEQFRSLRDGCEYDGDDGKVHKISGLFDETVFNDSVQEFLRKKAELANYFDESGDEDIFDYIPPQKTNQIFTPKWVVKKMADALEAENPGCFDDPNATFADLYMKSGLYITEIVKRLYHSNGLKVAFPDDKERIRHILREQVYGMAPTRIIYLIATNFILGFDETLKAETKNFVQADAAEAAKSGTLEQLVNEQFGGK